VLRPIVDVRYAKTWIVTESWTPSFCSTTWANHSNIRRNPGTAQIAAFLCS